MSRYSFSVSRFHSLRRLPASLLLYISITLLLVGCSRPKTDVAVMPIEDTSDNSPKEAFHADNDIAMTIRSITDAINEGEELDSLDYNYEGILTDGTGRPLYTDIQGAPGIWQIKVINPDELIIRNLYLGDLLPEALESYITQSLGLSETNLIDVSEINTGETSSTSMYNFPGGYLRFDTTTALTPAGQEGPLLTITVAEGLPS
ncbi:MAG: hypothetical protein K2N05_11815 [Muribaculaceae bacterium]|nr:hypothetical protein [Muribaculaceae bacterium]